jgi:hypothetical protein
MKKLFKELCGSLGYGMFAFVFIVAVCSAIFGMGIIATNLLLMIF